MAEKALTGLAVVVPAAGAAAAGIATVLASPALLVGSCVLAAGLGMVQLVRGKW
jgi:hypothetical protein